MAPSTQTLIETFARWEPALLGVMFAGLALLGAGYFMKGPRSHWARIAGWGLFGVYWPFQAPHFFWGPESDPVNGWFVLLGPLFLGYIAYHEYLSWKWGEDPAALRWFTGASFVAAATYFFVYKVEPITNWLIHTTTVQSAWMLRALFRMDAQAAGDDIIINGTEYAVTIILACTAIQSIMIFVGAIACTKAETRRKWLAYLYTVPVIYVLNLFRNAGIVFGYKVLVWNPFGWGPVDSGSVFWHYEPSYDYGAFEWMHSYVGKFGSLFAMVLIALAVFRTLPELHGNILDVFDLWKRRRPGFFKPQDDPRPAKSAPANAAASANTPQQPPTDAE